MGTNPLTRIGTRDPSGQTDLYQTITPSGDRVLNGVKIYNRQAIDGELVRATQPNGAFYAALDNINIDFELERAQEEESAIARNNQIAIGQFDVRLLGDDGGGGANGFGGGSASNPPAIPPPPSKIWKCINGRCTNTGIHSSNNFATLGECESNLNIVTLFKTGANWVISLNPTVVIGYVVYHYRPANVTVTTGCTAIIPSDNRFSLFLSTAEGWQLQGSCDYEIRQVLVCSASVIGQEFTTPQHSEI